MCAIDIGIGHNDDLVITQFADIKVFMDTCSKSCDHCLDLCISIDSVKTCLLNIEDLASKRKDCLCRTVSRCLGRTACGISLYDIDLAVLRILV